ncbi:MAG TPA: class I SAM-dependent methyltransferase [Enhygromyxa sp.]|nr:class I SAM-dependent methyltransferase [Enhygromyxa sp.]
MALFRRTRKPEPELIPYMDPGEFAQLMAILETLAPARMLEWGSGGSTKAILERCPFVERLVSVEHDRDWHQRVRERVVDPRLELHLVEPDQPMPRESDAYWAFAERAERERELFASYVDFPASLDTIFDFVFIDGRARSFCIEAGWPLLRSGGVLVVHDAQRPAYHPALARLGARPVFLEPFRSGQICLVRKPT